MSNRPDDYLENDLDVSPGGSQIFRHKAENHDSGVENSCVYIEEICAHFDSLHPGRETRVLHEIVSEFVHIDVHVMYPTAEEDFFVIYTTGMSDKPMFAPHELPNRRDWQFAEVFTYLPASWNPEAGMTRENMWAVEMLKFTARMPHMYKTWLADGHTIPNGPNYEAFLPNSELSAILLLGMAAPTGSFVAADNNKINLYYLAPLTRKETKYKLKKGTDKLLEKFDKKKVSFVIDAFRKSCV